VRNYDFEREGQPPSKQLTIQQQLLAKQLAKPSQTPINQPPPIYQPPPLCIYPGAAPSQDQRDKDKAQQIAVTILCNLIGWPLIGLVLWHFASPVLFNIAAILYFIVFCFWPWILLGLLVLFVF
jgi:hypothetical protein